MVRTTIILVCVLIIFICIAVCEAQNETEVTSVIEAVTVYPSYAVVQRMAALHLQSGEQWFVIPELPGTLDDGSVRASIEPKDGVRIEDVRVETWFLESPAELGVAQLEAEIQNLETKMKELDNQIAIHNEKLKFLQSIRVSSATQASESLKLGKIDTNAWSTALDFLDANMSDNYDGISQAQVQKNEIAKQLEVLQKQLQRIKTSKPRQQKIIYVGVSVTEPIESTLRISYLMREARWSPSYEMRANTELNELELSYFGNIRQKTGEDWDDVTLTLSTARPARGALISELTPWYLDGILSGTDREALPAEVSLESPRYVLEAEEVDKAVLPSPPPPSTLEAKGISVTFQITGTKQIHSGEGAEKILIMRESIPVEFEYATVPKLSPFAYLTSKGQNESEYPLLAGDVAVFVDGEYIGKSALKNIAPNEEFELSLGGDESIRVERELVEKFVQRKGLLGKKIEENFVFRIKIKNLKTHPCMISVQDQLPISRDATIEIKEIEINPEPTEYDEENGLVTWSVELQPKGEIETTFAFTVSYPKGKRPQRLF